MRPCKIFQLLVSSLALLRWEAMGAVEVLVHDANEIAVDLAAFQILYTTVEGYACSLDQFRLVAATRQHLTSLLGRQDSNFIGLELQHTLRSTVISGSSDPIFRNGTRAVFVGRAIYNETAPTADAMRDMENLCFLGENQTLYVKSLRELGCTTLEQAHLMTSAGDGVVLSHDDDEQENNNQDADNADRSNASSENDLPQSSSNPPPATTTTSQGGENDTSKSDIILITVIALLVPVSLLLFLLMVYIVRQQIVSRINWETLRKVSDKDPYWRADHPMALERMKVISSGFEPAVLESCKGCISTDDGSSSAYIHEEQQQPPQQQQQQARSSPQRSSPQRRQQSRLALELASEISSSSGKDNDDDESAEICSNTSITVHV